MFLLFTNQSSQSNSTLAFEGLSMLQSCVLLSYFILYRYGFILNKKNKLGVKIIILFIKFKNKNNYF